MVYDNTQRQASARATRARVVETAKRLFLERGFGGTTIRRVAEDAGVSQETIYKTFGGKAALLKSVYDVTLAGDDADLTLAQRPEAAAVLEAKSPAAAAAAYAELARLISSRTDPLLRVLLGVRDTDKALIDFARTIDEERHLGSSFYVRHWVGTGWLREDITIDQVIDSLWALNSPQPRWLLLDRGWSEEQFARWLADAIHHAVFANESR